MNKNILLTIILGIFILTLVQANLGTYQLDKCVNIKTILNATQVNISTISYPNSTMIILNQPMDKNSNTFNYTFCSNSVIGTYIYDYNDNNGNVFVNSYKITPSGKETDISQAILYTVFLFIILLLDLLILYLIIVLPSKDEKDDEGIIVRVIRLKYLRIFLIGIFYPMIIVTLNLVLSLSVNFTTLTTFTNVIGFIFETLLRLAWIWSFIIMLWILIRLIKDTNTKKLIREMNPLNDI